MSKLARQKALDALRASVKRSATGVGFGITMGKMTVDMKDWVSLLAYKDKGVDAIKETSGPNVREIGEYSKKLLTNFDKWVSEDKNHSNWVAENPGGSSSRFSFDWYWTGGRQGDLFFKKGARMPGNKSPQNADDIVQNECRDKLIEILVNITERDKDDIIKEIGGTGTHGRLTYEHGEIREGDANGDPTKFRGSRSEARIREAIDKSELPRMANTLNIFEDYIAEYYDLDTELIKNRGDKGLLDQFIVQGRMTLDNNQATKNPGTLDRKMITDFESVFGGKGQVAPASFQRFAQKYIERNPTSKSVQDLWSDSKNPIDYLQANTIDVITTKLTKGLKNAKKFTKGLPDDRGKAKDQSSPKTVRPSKTKKTNKKRGRPTKVNQAKAGNPIALKELINAVLPQELLNQMGSPRLNNRTGRFRQSAQVTNTVIGPRGSISIDYTYQLNPYQTFEPGGAQGSTARDPRSLIGGTIREIATEIVGRRFIKTRRV